MTKRYDVAKERKWRRVLGRWRRSGLSIRAFCAVERIGEHLFYWWRRELARRDQHQVARTRAATKPAAHKRVTGTTKSAAFVPVRVVADSGAGIEIVLRGGQVVRLQTGFDQQALTQVLAILEGRSC
jgi:hypothetical protein